MHAPLPLTRDVVLIGGGHTHALVLRRWGMALQSQGASKNGQR